MIPGLIMYEMLNCKKNIAFLEFNLKANKKKHVYFNIVILFYCRGNIPQVRYKYMGEVRDIYMARVRQIHGSSETNTWLK